MNKDKLGDVLSSGGIKPVDRSRVLGQEVFIADGFIPPPHHHLARFGVKPGEFPEGCYMTVWWIEQGKGRGGAAFFKPDHDPLLTASFKPKARINAMIKAAAYDIKKSKNVH